MCSGVLEGMCFLMDVFCVLGVFCFMCAGRVVCVLSFLCVACVVSITCSEWSLCIVCLL